MNPTQKELVCLKATVESLDFAMERIRGKANLTREVLTPKISAIISSLIGLIRIIPEETVPVLYKLIMAHANTFRPFGSKLEKELLAILANGSSIEKLPAHVLDAILKCLALLSFNLSRNDVGEQWSLRMTNLMLELRSVLSLYESLLDLESNPVYTSKLKSLPLPKDNDIYLFGTLDIDINESPLSIRKASDRIAVLLLLIEAQLQVTTQNIVSVPIGQLISLNSLLINLPTLASIKADVRGAEIHNAIKGSLSDIQKSSLSTLIRLVDLFGCDVYPHMYDIIATLDSSIPVTAKNGKLHVNKSQVIENQNNVKLIIDLTSNCLNLVERWTDMSILTRIHDSSFILTEEFQLPNPSYIPTAGQAAATAVEQGSSKKKSAKKSNISFSDYLSDPKSFVEYSNKEIMVIIRKFFKSLITKCELSTGKLNSIVRWVILDSLNHDNKELLESILLFPGKSDGAISAFPMIVNLLKDQSGISNLLMNPRLPLLPQLATVSTTRQLIANEEFEEEDESFEEEQGSNSVVDQIADIGNDLKRKHVEESTEETTDKKLKTDYSGLVVKDDVDSTSVEKIKRALVEEVPVESQSEKRELPEEEASRESDDEDMGSDFEIPEINVD